MTMMMLMLSQTVFPVLKATCARRPEQTYITTQWSFVLLAISAQPGRHLPRSSLVQLVLIHRLLAFTKPPNVSSAPLAHTVLAPLLLLPDFVRLATIVLQGHPS